MADYSGAWHCDECGASGNGYGVGEHALWCSVTERLARMARERRAAADAEATRRRLLDTEYRGLDDDELMKRLAKLKAEKTEAELRAARASELWQVAAREAMNRRLDWR